MMMRTMSDDEVVDDYDNDDKDAKTKTEKSPKSFQHNKL